MSTGRECGYKVIERLTGAFSGTVAPLCKRTLSQEDTLSSKLESTQIWEASNLNACDAPFQSRTPL